MDEDDAIDPAAIDRLERLGGNDLVGELTALFLELAPERMAAATEGLEAGDLDAVERAAHSLKSSAGNLGALRLMEASARLERLAEGGRADDVPAALEATARALDRAIVALARVDRAGGRVTGGGAGTIAYVEENADNRLLVSSILEGRYEVREYETGPRALEEFRVDPPDLVLLDISLPGMDGTEVLERMRLDPRTAGIPAIALTAHAMAGDREKYLAAGFDAYVSKPIVHEKVLLDAIRRLLGE